MSVKDAVACIRFEYIEHQALTTKRVLDSRCQKIVHDGEDERLVTGTARTAGMIETPMGRKGFDREATTNSDLRVVLVGPIN